MLRFGLNIVLAISISASGLFAFPGKENVVSEDRCSGGPVVMSKMPVPNFPDEAFSLSTTQGDESDGSQWSAPPKRKISEVYGPESVDKLASRSKRVQRYVPASPTAEKSPMKAIEKSFRPVRTHVAISKDANPRKLNLVSSGADDKDMDVIDTPGKLRTVYIETFPSNHFTHTGTFEGVPYHLNIRLFDLNQLVIGRRNGVYILETNYDRVMRGCAPFSYKVAPIVQQFLDHPFMAGNPDHHWGVDYIEDLYQKQNEMRLDLHHLLKTMLGTAIPLPSGFHHGTDLGVVVKDCKVLAYGVSRKDARHLLKNGAKYYGDCLHPDFGDSKIDRKAFGKWRKRFWKYVARLIQEEKENGTYNPSPKLVPEIPIFSVSSTQE